jgi:hypothetical protein
LDETDPDIGKSALKGKQERRIAHISGSKKPEGWEPVVARLARQRAEHLDGWLSI